MATGQEILSYQGSGGLGSSPGVPAIPEKTDWDALNKGVERMLINNADKNRRVYEQKLKDRDKLMQAIDSGDVKVGDILEEDMGWVKEGLSGLDDKFFNRVKVGAKHGMGSNEFIDADREYKKAAREAQDRVTQAGARFIGEKTQMTAIAEEKLPRKKEAMIKNLESWRKNKWGEVAPYQQTLDFDFDKIKGYVKMRTTQGVDPKNPLMKVKTTSADANSTLQEAQKDFLENNEERENQSALLEQYQSLPPAELKEQLTIFNNRLKPLGVQIEFEEFDTPNGKVYAIKDSIPEFAGKWALGVHPQLQSSESEFDDKYANYLQNERELQSLDRDRRGRLGLDWTKFNYAKDEDIGGASSALNEAKDIISKGVETTVEDGGKKKTVIRIGDPTLLKSFGNIDKDGNVSNVPDAIEYDKNTDQVKLIYYDGQTASGKNKISKEVALDQRTWLKEIVKRSYPNKDVGKINSLIDDVLTKNGNSLFKLTQKGSDGKVDQTYYNDANNVQSQSGNKVTYKDGSVWEISGGKMKKIK